MSPYILDVIVFFISNILCLVFVYWNFTMSDLKKVFDRHCGTINVDSRFLRKLKHYHDSLFNKDDDTMSFFGGGLWGVYPIFFDKADINTWFEEIMDVDDIELKQEVHELPTINPNYKVSSSILNLSLFYIVHRNLRTNSLSPNDKMLASVLVLRILHYRLISSLQGHYFRYKADKSIALAVYSSLSMRFSVKCYGSWGKLIDGRAEDILSNRSIHRIALERFQPDEQIIYMVNDVQGRIRDVCKKLNAEFYRLRDEETSIGTTSKLLAGEEGEYLKDTIDDYNKYRQYMGRTIRDKSSLIRHEIIDIVSRTIHRLPQDTLQTVLIWLNNNIETTHNKMIESWLDNLIGHAFQYIQDNKIKTNQLALILSKLRTVYLASRISDERLIESKELGSRITTLAIPDRSQTVRSTVRTATMLYIVMRMLIK